VEIEFRLIDKSEMGVIVPLLSELDSSIPEAILQARLEEMVTRGYECVGLYADKELIGICGLWTLVKYYVGRHIEPDNVYIKPAFRGLGIGTQLDEWLINFATERGCDAIELNCYVSNETGQRYWEANNYDGIGIHYQKQLKH
jgi:GNAT superfamily N-acetyltransferase